MTTKNLTLAFLLVLWTPGCGDDGGGDDGADTDGTTTDPTTSETMTTMGTTMTTMGMDTSTGGPLEGYAAIQDIFNTNCSCHLTLAGSGGLVLSDPAHGNIVGVESSVVGVNYIEPNDTEASYLWLKINGSHADVGGATGQMPLGGMLDPADLMEIEDWINDGAPS